MRIKTGIIRKWGRKGYSRVFTTTSALMLLVTIWILNFSEWLYFLTAPAQLEWGWFILGVILVGIGVIIAGAAARIIDINTIADMRSDRKPELVTDGIYARIRHPLYLATLLIFGGLALIYPFPKMIIFAGSFCGYVLIGAYLEERKLVVQYGQEYLEYRKKAGFLIPK